MKRRSLLKRVALIVIGLGFAGLLGQLVSTIYMTRMHKVPGKYVQTPNGKLHLHCTGEKAHPLILLEAGAIGWSQTWGWVQPELAKRYRVCSYDRPGLGWSETNETPDAVSAVLALHYALTKTGERLSNVTLVGHSYGAIVGRAFIAQYPDIVTKFVQVDGSHPEQFSLLPSSFVNKAKVFNDLLQPLAYVSYTGLTRLFNPLGKLAKDLPQETHFAVRYFGSDPTHLLTAYTEMELWEQSAVLAKNADLTDKIMLVISAAYMPDATEYEYNAWIQLHKSTAALSRYSIHKVIPNTDHYSLLMNKEHAQTLAAHITNFIERNQ